MLPFVQISSRAFFAVKILFTLEYKSDQRKRPNPKNTKNGGQRYYLVVLGALRSGSFPLVINL